MKLPVSASILAFIFLLLFPACKSSSTFTQFYNEHKRDCRLAVTFPRWAGLSFIPRDERPIVTDMTRGIKRVRLLYEQDQVFMRSRLSSFLDAHEYSTFLYLRENGTNLRIFALEDGEYIHEIIFETEVEGEVVVFALEGHMPKTHFSQIVKEVNEK